MHSNRQRRETLTSRCKDLPMLRQDLNNLVGRSCNRTSPLQRPAVLLQYPLGKLVWIANDEMFLPKERSHSSPGRIKRTTYQTIKSEHPAGLELRPEIITPKAKLPPPPLHLRDRLRVSIQPRAHQRIDPRTAVHLWGVSSTLDAPDRAQGLLHIGVLGIAGGRLEAVPCSLGSRGSTK